jgi:hypothetical protein
VIKISKTINLLLHIWDFDAEEDAVVGGIVLIKLSNDHLLGKYIFILAR